MKRQLARRNPVAAALRHPALKNKIVPARNNNEKRAKDKLRRFLREYRSQSPALFSLGTESSVTD